jgi:hypothetical protein
LASPSQYAAEFCCQQKISAGIYYFHDREGFDSACVGDVGPCTEIDEWATTVDCGAFSVGDFIVDEVYFVFAVLEHFQ